MEKPTVAYLFELPSMANSLLVAGDKGIRGELDRIDILETPYPEVEVYLETNEFIFTSFWNSKDNKEARVGLVRSMINHHCAGIGIMAGLILNGVIDEEIIELGNRNNFPVISIDNQFRYSDIIREYYMFLKNVQEPFEKPNFDLYKILSNIDNYHAHLNIQLLCNELSSSLCLPIIILTKGEVHASHMQYPSGIKDKIIKKINGVWSNKALLDDTPGKIFISDRLQAFCLFGIDSVFVALIQTGETQETYWEMLEGVAKFITSSIDKKKVNAFDVKLAKLENNMQYYCFYIRKDNILQVLPSLRQYGIVYEMNENFNYAVCLIEQQQLEASRLFILFSRVIETVNPTCFIFSQSCSRLDKIRPMIQHLVSQINSMYSLKGIYTFGEIGIIYILNIAPYSQKKPIVDFQAQNINYEAPPLFLDTLRLFIVLKNINKVAELLNIHTNTVKYRILKSIDDHGLDTTNITADVWNLDLLIPLENFKLEDITEDS